MINNILLSLHHNYCHIHNFECPYTNRVILVANFRGSANEYKLTRVMLRCNAIPDITKLKQF